MKSNRMRVFLEHVAALAVAALFMLVLAGQALAAEAAPVVTEVGIDWARLLPGLGTIAATVVLTVIGAIWRGDAKRERAEQVFLSCVRIAFFVTNEIKGYTKTTVDDTIATALGVLQAELEKRGLAMTDERKAQAKALWQAMNGEEKTHQKNLVRALEKLSAEEKGGAAPLAPSAPLAGR
jgi:hypothetical protein